jgi:hypothetical protein
VKYGSTPVSFSFTCFIQLRRVHKSKLQLSNWVSLNRRPVIYSIGQVQAIQGISEKAENVQLELELHLGS